MVEPKRRKVPTDETGKTQDNAKLTTHRRFPKTLSTSGMELRLSRHLGIDPQRQFLVVKETGCLRNPRV